MNYKYKKNQLFGKRLNVPKNILRTIYIEYLSLQDFYKYELDDKIPISCLDEKSRTIVERFGIEKCRNLDFDLINDPNFSYNSYKILMEIDPQVEDINIALYESIKDIIEPSNYKYGMKKLYSDRIIDEDSIEDESFKRLANDFNKGRVDLVGLVSNWDLFKDRDLSYCLNHDSHNDKKITGDIVKDVMNDYSDLVSIISKYGSIYDFFSDVSSCDNKDDRLLVVKKYLDNVLQKTYNGSPSSLIKLNDEEYKKIFKYSSIKEYLINYKKIDSFSNLYEELKTLPNDYVFNIPFPFEVFLDSEVISFFNKFGLKNIVDFDNNNGHIFSMNDCYALKVFYSLYLQYGLDKKVEINNTKEDLYNFIRAVIINGPSNLCDLDKIPDYSLIKGEFRDINEDLFLSEEAPLELKKLYYYKGITPGVFKEHPEYIPYLDGKESKVYFKKIMVKVFNENKNGEFYNLYPYLKSNLEFNEFINFIIEYDFLFEILFDREKIKHPEFETVFYENDSLDQIKNRMFDKFKLMVIKGGISYSDKMPKELKDKYPSLFLSDDAPEELKDAFYNRKITPSFIISNSEYKKYLKNVDLEILFDYMLISDIPIELSDIYNSIDLGDRRIRRKNINIVNAIKNTFGDDYALDVMILYGDYINELYKIDRLENFVYNPKFTKDEFLDELDKIIYQKIIDGKIKYNENIPSHFKDNYPSLFLDSRVSQDIKDKFYNRKFTLKDFNDNPQLIELFGDTNIVCGFPLDLSFNIPLFYNIDNNMLSNYHRLKVISEYSKIDDFKIKSVFKEYIIDNSNDLKIEHIDYLVEVLNRLSITNSSEMYTFRKELAKQILDSDNPLESLDKIEDVFIRNNIPIVGKVYSCFEILHPDFKGFNFDNSMISPILKNSHNNSRKMIVFSDLIKASFGSNNRSINSYIRNIEYNSNLYDSIRNGSIDVTSLSDNDLKELDVFCKHLGTLYNNTMKAKSKNELFTYSGDTLKDLLKLSKLLSPDGSLDYNIGDRVIRMFCGFMGINTIEQAKKYIDSKVNQANLRNINSSYNKMVLNKGDFIKGVGDIKYLGNILQNGSVSKEYLGASADSDRTPLDTDISMINTDGTISEKVGATAAKNYGPIWFVLKNNDRFVTTRVSDSDIEYERNLSKLELFYTGALGDGHYGIRTGFASSDIDYIFMDKYDFRVGLEIAMNGFYIPVADMEGNIVFTPNDYNILRSKMSGLSYYGEDHYSFSENLITDETKFFVEQIEQSNLEVRTKRDRINGIIKKSLEELGLQLKTNIDGDLSEGFVELIDTGSTGRGTNKPGDGDFDFMMRLDKTILGNPERLKLLKQTILRNLGIEYSSELIDKRDFRLKDVQIDTDMNVDIDISFVERTDKVTYSTDMAVNDRLATIYKCDPEKYKYVIANILLAKKVLKEAEAYKPNRGEVPQGGLGGVGIENWILQNGGSFVDAVKSFLSVAKGKSFEEFIKCYSVWDFGENHLAERRGEYSHDNFVSCNMSEDGYKKMCTALKNYLDMYLSNQNNNVNVM